MQFAKTRKPKQKSATQRGHELIDRNYCRAHKRFGQDWVDRWGAWLRCSIPDPEIDHSSYIPDPEIDHSSYLFEMDNGRLFKGGGRSYKDCAECGESFYGPSFKKYCSRECARVVKARCNRLLRARSKRREEAWAHRQ
jgi:hypothetical protein